MSEPANSPPEDVAGRDVPDTLARGSGPVGSGQPDQPGQPDPPDPPGQASQASEPGRARQPVEPAEPEPPLSLKPPNAKPTPPPLEADTVRIVVIGTSLWFAGFLVLLPFRGRLAEDGNEVWLWTCLAGGLLGLLGLFLSVRARAASRRG